MSKSMTRRGFFQKIYDRLAPFVDFIFDIDGKCGIECETAEVDKEWDRIIREMRND